jgi:hypothetical protein
VKIRLIKAGSAPQEPKTKEPADDITASDDTMRVWVDEFKSKKAARIRRDLNQLVAVKKGSRARQ